MVCGLRTKQYGIVNPGRPGLTWPGLLPYRLMTNWYLWLKVLHVLAVTVWLGAAVSVFAIMTRLSPTMHRERLAALAGACDIIGSRVIAPAGGLSLLIGIAAAWAGHTGMAFWIWWGLGAAIVVLAVGGSALRLGFARLAAMLESPNPEPRAVTALVGRLRTIGIFAIAVLVSAVGIMVLKP